MMERWRSWFIRAWFIAVGFSLMVTLCFRALGLDLAPAVLFLVIYLWFRDWPKIK